MYEAGLPQIGVFIGKGSFRRLLDTAGGDTEDKIFCHYVLL